jgi:prophage antirepressor-like protein
MNEITMFRNPEFGEIRTVDMNGDTWFVGRDIAAVLGYSKPQNAIASHVDEDDTLIQGITDSMGRTQSTTLINESGVYALIFSSKLDKAKQFKHWVTSEVLPAIRKHGAYVPTQSDQTALDIQLLNARTMNANIYVNLLQHVDTKSESYKAILMACAANTAAGQLVLPLPKADFGKTYSATDIGRILGISRNKVGRIANEHGLKSDGFGEWYHDVASNGKECDNFRYNDAAIEKFREILGA